MMPTRPKSGNFNLTQEEMDGLSYYVLLGASKEVAFLKFVRPDFIGSKSTAVVKSAVQQFFALKDVKDYLEAYKNTIDDIISKKKDKEKTKENKGTLEERKARALSKLVEYVIAESDKIGTEREGEVDVKAIMEFANKIGIFDQQEEVEEQPRRYLPVTCSICEYRKFVEENCERVEDKEETNNQ